MATAAELLFPLRPGLVPVPAAGQSGVCRICHSGCDPRFGECIPCREAVQRLGADEILPISMSVEGELTIDTSVGTRTIAAARCGPA